MLPAARGYEMEQDIKNPEVVNNFWEGAIPVWQAFGEPIAGEHNKIKTPKYLKDWAIKKTNDNKTNAYAVAEKPYPYDPYKFEKKSCIFS